ncbi:MAG: nucleotide exchange factor GrpE [Patescibacteria group bacterium]|nr:nucleotide exchange factor GrpE [Patescibacteria group bacterium]
MNKQNKQRKKSISKKGKEDKEIKEISKEKYEVMHNDYKRALADYQNLIKRTAKEKQDFARYANEQLLYEIIPVYDNLKTSFKHIDEAAKSNGWAEGIKYVIKQFKDILSNLGIEEIETVGEKFNPHVMEAIEGKGDKVKKEIKAGYKLSGKVIIPAKVILE